MAGMRGAGQWPFDSARGKPVTVRRSTDLCVQSPQRLEWVRRGSEGTGIFAIVLPLCGVLRDVQTDGVELFDRANDVLVIVALPDGTSAIESTVYGCRKERFESSQYASVG